MSHHLLDTDIAPPPAFSASDAAIDGFRVIGSHWRLIVGWSAFNLLAMVILVVVTTIMIFIAAGIAGSRDEAATAIGAIGSLVGGLGALTVQAMMVGAVFRLLLRPGQAGFLGLRLGPDEIRLVVVWLAVLALMAGLSAVQYFAAGALGGRGGAAGSVALFLLVWGLGIYVLLRVSLTGPATVDRQRIGFAPSWRLTHGRVWALFGMMAMTLCLLALAAVLGWFAMLGLTGLLFGFEGMALFPGSTAEAVGASPGPYLFQLLFQLLFAPVLWVIVQAPLAAAYKALVAVETEVEA